MQFNIHPYTNVFGIMIHLYMLSCLIKSYVFLETSVCIMLYIGGIAYCDDKDLKFNWNWLVCRSFMFKWRKGVCFDAVQYYRIVLILKWANIQYQ